MPETTTPNYIVNGDQTVSFALTGAAPTIGSTAIAGGTIGWAQSSGSNRGSDKWEGRDENGNVFATVLYNQHGDISLSLLLKTDATLPAIGNKLTVGGKSGAIESVNIQWSNTEGTKVDITAHWYAGVTLT